MVETVSEMVKRRRRYATIAAETSCSRQCNNLCTHAVRTRIGQVRTESASTRVPEEVFEFAGEPVQLVLNGLQPLDLARTPVTLLLLQNLDPVAATTVDHESETAESHSTNANRTMRTLWLRLAERVPASTRECP